MQISSTTKSVNPGNFKRNEYGALDTSKVLTPEQVSQMKDLLAKAVLTGILTKPFISGDKKEYECVNNDIYDALIFRGKVKGLVVQSRYFWKNLRKGYTRGKKTYFLVIRNGVKVKVTQLETSTCAKRAKNCVKLGQLVNHYLSKEVLACKASGPDIYQGFKVLAKTPEGKLVSAYDDSEYSIGTWRIEEVKPDHDGGFYFYDDREFAIAATQVGATFHASVTAGKPLVLCEIEYSGNTIRYDGKKRAASRLRVISELEEIFLNESNSPTVI